MSIGIMTGLRAAIVVGIFATGLMALEQAQAQVAASAPSHRDMPVPTITIYPGETIKEGVLAERAFSASAVASLPVVAASDQLVGKVARRTLLPGQLVPRNAVEEARLVERGKPVQVIFAEAGMTIVTVASPLQSGGVGEMVQARNLDSGVTIVGTVQPDGTLRVGE
ncbi:MAG TPA: flagellar basal body P-ring formation chaperone FlgA [Saliniramus sp.]|nr:flagellar basal body P-ring formation chaperone FlgA [Saliniramus sp.]